MRLEELKKQKRREETGDKNSRRDCRVEETKGRGKGDLRTKKRRDWRLKNQEKSETGDVYLGAESSGY